MTSKKNFFYFPIQNYRTPIWGSICSELNQLRWKLYIIWRLFDLLHSNVITSSFLRGFKSGVYFSIYVSCSKVFNMNGMDSAIYYNRQSKTSNNCMCYTFWKWDGKFLKLGKWMIGIQSVTKSWTNKLKLRNKTIHNIPKYRIGKTLLPC